MLLYVLALSMWTSAAASNVGLFSPLRLSYSDLLAGHAVYPSVIEALQNSGMISITGVPNFPRLETLRAMEACLDENDMAADHVFEDGTRRRTLATSYHGKKSQPLIEEDETEEYASCQDLERTSLVFRETVAAVTDHLALLLGQLHDEPILFTNPDRGDVKTYTLKDIVQQGEHLEHFHAYDSSKASAANPTLDWHTDQGLMLVFAPGATSDGSRTGAFYVQLRDETVAQVKFEAKDDLVIMLGDGVNQYVNTNLQSPLRAVPHALNLYNEEHEDDATRYWYGRMVLPPVDARHPVYDKTFGQMRQDLIQEHTEEAVTISCAGSPHHRALNETTCDADKAHWCWHRCMNFTDYDANHTSCAERGLSLACVNEDGYLWPLTHDPQFGLGCADLDTAVVFEESTANPGNDTEGDEGSGDPGDEGSGAPVWTYYLGVVLSVLAMYVY